MGVRWPDIAHGGLAFSNLCAPADGEAVKPLPTLATKTTEGDGVHNWSFGR